MDIDTEQAKRTLDSMITDYDRRIARRCPNIYRLGHLLGASSRVFAQKEPTEGLYLAGWPKKRVKKE